MSHDASLAERSVRACGECVGPHQQRRSVRGGDDFATPATAARTTGPRTGATSVQASLGLRMEEALVSKPEIERALAEMHRQMATLRSQMSQLEHAQASRATEHASLTAMPTRDAAAAADPRARQEARRQAEAQAQAKAALIEGMLATEEADASWAPAAGSSLAAIFQHEELQGLRLVSVECRSTLYRIDIAAHASVEDGSSFDEDLRKLLLRTPWSGQGFGRVDPDGPPPTAVFFLARGGHALPQLTH
jgi:hypothetical protein